MIRKALLALFVACAGAGLVVLVSGATTETRVFGALGLFFAVVAAVATAGELFTRPDAQAVRMTTVNAEPAFVFPTSRAKLGMLFVLVGVFVGLGVVAAISIAETGFWLCVGAFAVALAFGARKVLWPPSLVLTPTGVTVGPRHSAWLEWNDVARVDTVSVGDNEFVRVKTKGGLADRLQKDFLIPVGTFVGTDKFVMASVKRYIHDKDRRRRIGTEAELERITR